jgi:glycosyltransferase involved in cell wall biosynthesis
MTMQRKKIVHLISSLKIGGAESLLYDLIIGLGSEKYEHHVVYFHGGPNVERLERLGIPTYHMKGLITLYDPVFFWRSWRLIAQIKPDVLHTALWAANFVGRIIGFLQKIPTVCAVHLGVNLDGKFRNQLDAVTFGLATHVVAVSEGVAQSVHDRSWIPAQKVQVIKNGMDTQAVVERGMKQNCNRQELGLTAEHFVIGAVGRFIARKNFDILIESFSLFHAQQTNARLVLIGLGPQESFLRQKAKDLGVEKKVIFVIGKPAYGYYPLFDCFALPSTQEGLSIALLEALCFKVPPIVTSPDGQHEVIQHRQNGLVVKPNDARALCGALQEMGMQDSARLAMGKNAEMTVREKFSFDRMVNAYKTVFTNVAL